MMEITATEQNKEKRMKRNEKNLRPLGQHKVHQSQKEKRKRKNLRKDLKRY